MNNLQIWRKRWQDAGIDVIPIAPNKKRSVIKNWQNRSPENQWHNADPDSNIAVLVGGNLIRGIDCDSPKTIERVRARLEGLGLSLPEVETLKGGRHFYARIEGVPKDITWKNLAKDLGSGEFRASNAYLLAPCSMVGGRKYWFVKGNPESIAHLPILRWDDFSWLLPRKSVLIPNQDTSLKSVNRLPIKLIKRKMPIKAKQLFDQLRFARKGQQVDKYPSRSEAEAAIVMMLVLSGWSLEDIFHEFNKRSSGHFREQHQPWQYLAITHHNVISNLLCEPIRKVILDSFQKAHLIPWPTARGALALATYQAFLSICWQFRSWEVSASTRDLALYAAGSPGGVVNAIEYLKVRRLIELVARGEGYLANRYKVLPIEVDKLNHNSQGELGYMRGLLGEIWGYQGLGRSAGMVFALLSENPICENELANVTGKHEKTIHRALSNLCSNGLAEIVQDGHGSTNRFWKLGQKDLTSIASELEVEDAANLRRHKFEIQSNAWRRWTTGAKQKNGGSKK